MKWICGCFRAPPEAAKPQFHELPSLTSCCSPEVESFISATAAAAAPAVPLEGDGRRGIDRLPSREVRRGSVGSLDTGGAAASPPASPLLVRNLSAKPSAAGSASEVPLRADSSCSGLWVASAPTGRSSQDLRKLQPGASGNSRPSPSRAAAAAAALADPGSMPSIHALSAATERLVAASSIATPASGTGAAQSPMLSPRPSVFDTPGAFARASLEPGSSHGLTRAASSRRNSGQGLPAGNKGLVQVMQRLQSMLAGSKYPISRNTSNDLGAHGNGALRRSLSGPPSARTSLDTPSTVPPPPRRCADSVDLGTMRHQSMSAGQTRVMVRRLGHAALWGGSGELRNRLLEGARSGLDSTWLSLPEEDGTSAQSSSTGLAMLPAGTLQTQGSSSLGPFRRESLNLGPSQAPQAHALQQTSMACMMAMTVKASQVLEAASKAGSGPVREKERRHSSGLQLLGAQVHAIRKATEFIHQSHAFHLQAENGSSSVVGHLGGAASPPASAASVQQLGSPVLAPPGRLTGAVTPPLTGHSHAGAASQCCATSLSQVQSGKSLSRASCDVPDARRLRVRRDPSSLSAKGREDWELAVSLVPAIELEEPMPEEATA